MSIYTVSLQLDTTWKLNQLHFNSYTVFGFRAYNHIKVSVQNITCLFTGKMVGKVRDPWVYITVIIF